MFLLLPRLPLRARDGAGITLTRSVWLRAGMLMMGMAHAGCVLGPSPPCTADARAGLIITVTNGATGERICDATVHVAEGAYGETLMPFGGSGDCAHYGAREREGTYRIEASRTGFVSHASVVIVGSDECHVQTQRRSYALQVL